MYRFCVYSIANRLVWWQYQNGSMESNHNTNIFHWPFCPQMHAWM